MTREEFEAAREEIHDLFDDVREDMAEDVDNPVPDGGET